MTDIPTLLDFSSYAPKLPETVNVHRHFGSTREFFVDGYTPKSLKLSVDELPTFTFVDRLGKQVFIVTVDLVHGKITLRSEFNWVRTTTRTF